MTETTNYHLKKPDDTDPTDQRPFNENADSLDRILYELDSGKQDALSSEQLDAVNSGITTADVTQIETNKNNILLNCHYGVKNIFIPTAGNVNNATGFTGTITHNADNSYTINGSTGGSVYYLMLGKITMPVGTFVLYARPGDKTGISVYNDGDWIDSGTARYKTFSQPTSQNIFLRIAANQTLENYTIYPMICDVTAWNMSRDYEIGALSNAELTATKISMAQAYGYTVGYALSGTVDLDNLTTVGVYYYTAAAGTTITHAPTTSPFRMEVIQTAGAARYCQFMFANTENALYFRNLVGSTWTGWYKIAATAV